MAEPIVQPILETVRLSKRFGGVAAVNGVSLGFAAGRVHAVIGPNGAGKTTLLNLLSGEMRPTAGHVLFKGADITGGPPDRVSLLGIGRSFQRSNVFLDHSCRENCVIAAQSRPAGVLSLFRPLRRRPDVAERAERSLEACDLRGRADVTASALSHGERRQLEIAMMLATEPELLLLDEPLGGMGHHESARILSLLRRLSAGHTLVLIEHDMDAVFSVADSVTVMVDGGVLETGRPEQIRASRAVQDAYLGRADDPGVGASGASGAPP